MKRAVVLWVVATVASSLYAGGIVCDQDLTNETSGSCAEVTGGEFKDGGWINSGGGNVIFKAPSRIDKGWAQVDFIVDDISTSLQNKGKCIFFSMYDCEEMHQRLCTMKTYVRIRDEPERAYYLEFKARDIKKLHGEGETRLHTRNDWEKYYGKEMHIRFMWGPDRVVSMEYPKQDGSGDYETVTRGDYNITNIRYVVVGADGSYGCTFTGFRYTRLRVYDDAAGDDVPVAGHPARSPAHGDTRNFCRLAGDKIVFDLEGNRRASVYNLRGVRIASIGSRSPSLGLDALPPGRYSVRIAGEGAARHFPLLIR